MKSKNFLSNLWSSVAGSQRNDVEFDRRLTVGSPSGFTMNWTLKLVSVLVLVLTIGSGNVWGADTYKLTAVTSVSAGNKYVFVESGNALTGTISSSKLQSTTTFNTTGLNGSESYVWTLETADGGYYLKNVSVGASGYLRNSSSANLALSTSDQTNNVWTFSFGVSTAEICIGTRKIAGTSSGSTEYKAYSTIPSGAGYSFTVYRLDLEVTETFAVTWKSDGVTVHTDAAVPSGTTVSTPSDPSVPSGCTGAKFMGWTATENYSHATDAPGDLFNGTSPTINSAKTYYAVFADPN